MYPQELDEDDFRSVQVLRTRDEEGRESFVIKAPTVLYRDEMEMWFTAAQVAAAAMVIPFNTSETGEQDE